MRTEEDGDLFEKKVACDSWRHRNWARCANSPLLLFSLNISQRKRLTERTVRVRWDVRRCKGQRKIPVSELDGIEEDFYRETEN